MKLSFQKLFKKSNIVVFGKTQSKKLSEKQKHIFYDTTESPFFIAMTNSPRFRPFFQDVRLKIHKNSNGQKTRFGCLFGYN